MKSLCTHLILLSICFFQISLASVSPPSEKRRRISSNGYYSEFSIEHLISFNPGYVGNSGVSANTDQNFINPSSSMGSESIQVVHEVEEEFNVDGLSSHILTFEDLKDFLNGTPSTPPRPAAADENDHQANPSFNTPERNYGSNISTPNSAASVMNDLNMDGRAPPARRIDVNDSYSNLEYVDSLVGQNFYSSEEEF